jgi:hypothetical protein
MAIIILSFMVNVFNVNKKHRIEYNDDHIVTKKTPIKFNIMMTIH